MEHRKSPRFAVHWPVVFSGADKAGEGSVINLSIQGCAVESHMGVPRGTLLQVCTLIPDDDLLLAPDMAVVRWSSGRKFGVEFINIRFEEQGRLRHLVSTLETGPSHVRERKGEGPVERRGNARFQVQLTLDFLSQHAAGVATVSDLSTGGCKVDTKTSVYIGMYLPLQVYLPGHETPLHVEQAAVRWAEDQQYGLEFITMWPEESERLRRFVCALETGPSHSAQPPAARVVEAEARSQEGDRWFLGGSKRSSACRSWAWGNLVLQGVGRTGVPSPGP